MEGFGKVVLAIQKKREKRKVKGNVKIWKKRGRRVYYIIIIGNKVMRNISSSARYVVGFRRKERENATAVADKISARSCARVASK